MDPWNEGVPAVAGQGAEGLAARRAHARKARLLSSEQGRACGAGRAGDRDRRANVGGHAAVFDSPDLDRAGDHALSIRRPSRVRRALGRGRDGVRRALGTRRQAGAVVPARADVLGGGDQRLVLGAGSLRVRRGEPRHGSLPGHADPGLLDQDRLCAPAAAAAKRRARRNPRADLRVLSTLPELQPRVPDADAAGVLPQPDHVSAPRFASAAVASPHVLASEAGVEVLREGGNALDAAIAMNLTLGVVAPYLCGYGGDLFAIVWDGVRMHGYNGSGRAPAAATLDRFPREGVPMLGPL